MFWLGFAIGFVSCIVVAIVIVAIVIVIAHSKAVY